MLSLQRHLGTNPISMAARSEDDSFELDMATTTVALGKVGPYYLLRYVDYGGPWGTYVFSLFRMFYLGGSRF